MPDNTTTEFGRLSFADGETEGAQTADHPPTEKPVRTKRKPRGSRGKKKKAAKKQTNAEDVSAAGASEGVGTDGGAGGTIAA